MRGDRWMNTMNGFTLIDSKMTSINEVPLSFSHRWILLLIHARLGIVQNLQDLHDMLTEYHAPEVVHPSIESLKPPSKSIFGALFHRRPAKKASTQIPSNLPKGLYMYGDVGSGKTMLMDMFYETLPNNITSKTRIHFHNFMQDVHKKLHAMKTEHGTDLDAVQYVAADIAEKGSVLCFDEFQCTDVADAMILRRCARRVKASESSS